MIKKGNLVPCPNRGPDYPLMDRVMEHLGGGEDFSRLQREIDKISKKFYVGPGDDERFKTWCETAVALALDWLKNPEQKKIHADISLPELAEIFSETRLPLEGSPIDEVFEECKVKILDNSVRINNPRYIGHMTTVLPWFSVVVDILITSINQNQVKIETALASTFLERQTLTWLHRLIYAQPDSFYQEMIQSPGVSLGNTASGGTMGNLTALAVARETKLPGFRQKGAFCVYREKGIEKVVILASRRVHYSVAKAAAILGLGEEAVVTVPVDADNRIDLAELEATLTRLKQEKTLVLALVGIAGTTETGSIDPLPELAAIARREGIWFHVDAAWGGALLLSEDLKSSLKGIEEADSVVLDGHKLFYLAMSHSSILFKSAASLDTWRHNANYIIRKGSVDLGQTNLEGSRRFNALKLWFSLKMFGTQGYDALLKRAVGLAQQFALRVDQHPQFERTSKPVICILTYRFRPAQVSQALHRPELAARLNPLLNQLNVELQKRQRERGQSFTSRTTLESTGYPGDIVVLRAVLTNLLTTPEFLQEILEEQAALGEEIYQEMAPAFGQALA